MCRCLERCLKAELMRAGTEVIIIEDTCSDECIGIGLSEALKYITEIVEK